MSSTSITVIGNIVTEPEVRQVGNGLTLTRVRVASTDRKFNRTTNAWEDEHTSFYNVTCWRMLGERVAAQLKKGDPIVVTGKIQVKRWQKSDGHWDGSTDIEASTIGPDLRRVAVTVNRIPRGVSAPPTAPVPSQEVDPWASNIDGAASEPAA
jgi:single-strand DNA-binding protein